MRGTSKQGSRHSRFADRLLLAQGLVLLSGALTTWMVAVVVGPGIFRDHLRRGGVAAAGGEARHIEEAFASALLVSIAVALITAVLAALAVSWYISRKVEQSINDVAGAAAEIAAGRYSARVADPGLGVEFASLAETYNELADRLDAIETTRLRMLADLAHEMRTPLATIDAHLEAVEDGVRVLDEDTLGVVRGSTGRLRRLAEDMTAISRAEESGPTLTRTSIAAATIARTASGAARERYAAKQVQLRIELDDRARVLADAHRMGQVLGNLLDNALRHTPPGGVVTLSCHSSGRWVEFAVVDSGEGIEMRHLAHVFDRFYRADSARDRDHGGSGLGLAIVKSLVEGHGGTVDVASAGKGQGSTFMVRLPAHG